jgi:hypothetical protein
MTGEQQWKKIGLKFRSRLIAQNRPARYDPMPRNQSQPLSLTFYPQCRSALLAQNKIRD